MSHNQHATPNASSLATPFIRKARPGRQLGLVNLRTASEKGREEERDTMQEIWNRDSEGEGTHGGQYTRTKRTNVTGLYLTLLRNRHTQEQAARRGEQLQDVKRDSIWTRCHRWSRRPGDEQVLTSSNRTEEKGALKRRAGVDDDGIR